MLINWLNNCSLPISQNWTNRPLLNSKMVPEYTYCNKFFTQCSARGKPPVFVFLPHVFHTLVLNWCLHSCLNLISLTHFFNCLLIRRPSQRIYYKQQIFFLKTDFLCIWACLLMSFCVWFTRWFIYLTWCLDIMRYASLSSFILTLETFQSGYMEKQAKICLLRSLDFLKNVH